MHMICFFKQKTAYEMRISDWSSDVCSSDLQVSLGGKSLSGQLTDALDIVLAAPWLALEPRGGLFLVEEGALKLFIQRNLPEAFRSTWSKVTFGQGFCGRAAAEQRVIHAADVDDRLEVELGRAHV